MEALARAKTVQGTWEKTEKGYHLRGTWTDAQARAERERKEKAAAAAAESSGPGAAPAPAAPVPAVAAPVPSRNALGWGMVAGFLCAVGAYAAVRLVLLWMPKRTPGSMAIPAKKPTPGSPRPAQT